VAASARRRRAGALSAPPGASRTEDKRAAHNSVVKGDVWREEIPRRRKAEAAFREEQSTGKRRVTRQRRDVALQRVAMNRQEAAPRKQRQPRSSAVARLDMLDMANARRGAGAAGAAQGA